jgi:uncharacterized membrane protein YccC
MNKVNIPFSAGVPRNKWREAVVDWAKTDGATWLYMLKVLIAVFLAMGVAMALDLQQPKTAMTTVFIVMQPQTGPVLSKSYYRICGTLSGLTVMMVLVALFSQQPELFILSSAIWVGICTAGAARNRNFRSYGFLLAGYTAALIGIPVSQHPQLAFITATTRVAEVTIGILSAGLVSALLFPRHVGTSASASARNHFRSFVAYASGALYGSIERSDAGEANVKFATAAVQFESARSSMLFEGPDARLLAKKIAKLNREFMTAATRLHALYELLNRLRTSNETSAIAFVLRPYAQELADLLRQADAEILTAADAERISRKLTEYHESFGARITQTRMGLEADDAKFLPDLDTGAELLLRFIEDMNACAQTYIDIESGKALSTQSPERYSPQTNMVLTSVSGVRATMVVVILGMFWITSSWPSGATLTFIGAAICALASSFPKPSLVAMQMGLGTLLASITGLILTFDVYPRIDGFALLCAALTPFLLLGIYLTSKPKLAGYGVGYCIFFCFLAGPDNVIQYNPISYLNDSLALVMAMFACALAFSVFLPPSTPWLLKHLLGELRGQVDVACKRFRHGQREILRARFESGTRDLAHQIVLLGGSSPNFRDDSIRWLFAVLEVGNALIDLGTEIAAIDKSGKRLTHEVWLSKASTLVEKIPALFSSPNRSRYIAALSAVTDAIEAVELAQTGFISPDVAGTSSPRTVPLRGILVQLHVIRNALLDRNSPVNVIQISNG